MKRFDLFRSFALNLPFNLASSCIGNGVAVPNSVHVPEKICKSELTYAVRICHQRQWHSGDQLNLTFLLQRIQTLRTQLSSRSNPSDTESLAMRLEMNEAREEAVEIIQQANLECDYVEAQIREEQGVWRRHGFNTWGEPNRDEGSIAITNAFGFATNGALVRRLRRRVDTDLQGTSALNSRRNTGTY